MTLILYAAAEAVRAGWKGPEVGPRRSSNNMANNVWLSVSSAYVDLLRIRRVVHQHVPRACRKRAGRVVHGPTIFEGKSVGLPSNWMLVYLAAIEVTTLMS